MYVLKLIFNIRLKKVIYLDSITVIGLIKVSLKMNKARNIKVKLEKHFY